MLIGVERLFGVPNRCAVESETSICVQNSEILTLTYGGIVRQLVADTENVGEVNKKLKKM